MILWFNWPNKYFDFSKSLHQVGVFFSIPLWDANQWKAAKSYLRVHGASNSNFMIFISDRFSFQRECVVSCLPDLLLTKLFKFYIWLYLGCTFQSIGFPLQHCLLCLLLRSLFCSWLHFNDWALLFQAVVEYDYVLIRFLALLALLIRLALLLSVLRVLYSACLAAHASASCSFSAPFLVMSSTTGCQK